MDTPRLKQLASQVRSLFKRSNLPIGHNQSLDVIAALPGLRNWPEVVAFPERVAACELDLTSTSRLASRLKQAFGFDLSATELLAVLSGSGRQGPTAAQVQHFF